MDRRRFAAVVSSLATVGLAGCSSVSNDIDGVEYDEEMLVASLDEDHDVSRLEVISEDGERIYSVNVGTETRAELFNVIEPPLSFDDDTDHVGESLTIRAIDSEGDSIGETDIEYAPEIEVTDLDIDFREAEIQFTVMNVGEGPVSPTTNVEIDPVEITPEHELISEEQTLEFPGFELTDTANPPLSSLDEDRTVLKNEETEQVTREAEPIVSDLSIDPEELESFPEIPNTYSISVEDPIENEEIPLDKTEVTVGFSIDVTTEPPELDESFEGEIEFSGLSGHRDRGNQLITGDVRYTVQIVADDVELVSFEGSE